MTSILRMQTFAVLAVVACGTFAQPAAKPEAPAQPGLAALVAPRVPELRAAGVRQILARTDKGRRDIQVLAQFGPSYFAWPKGTTPVPFEIYLDADGRVSAFASGFDDASKPRFAAALDAIVPPAVRAANQARANATRPKP